MNTFSAGSCIKFGWETFKRRPWFLIGSFALFFVVVFVVGAALDELNRLGGLMSLLSGLVRIVFDVCIGMSILAFILKAHDDIEHVSLADFLRLHPFWKYFGAMFLFMIMFIVGFILLIVPGIYVGLTFGLVGYLVIDKQLSPVDALKESARITRGNKWELFLLGLLCILIVLLGIICLVVGALVAYPVVTLAMAHAFRTLQQKASPAPVA